MRKCTRCGKIKSITEFSRDRHQKDGYRFWCKECMNKSIKKWRQKNRKKIKEYVLRYSQTHIEKIKKYKKEYNQRLEVVEKRKKKIRDRWKVDINFRLGKNMGTIIGQALKGKKAGKSWKTLVDYSLQDLIEHLEKQFEPWMNWENYGRGKGKWNIDHIKPITLFHFISIEDKEFKLCWALSNLQPLDAIKNISKGNKYYE